MQKKLFELQIFQCHKHSQSLKGWSLWRIYRKTRKAFYSSEVSNHQHKFLKVEEIKLFVGFYFSPIAPRPWLRLYMGQISVRLRFKSQLNLKANVLHIKELLLLPLAKILSPILLPKPQKFLDTRYSRSAPYYSLSNKMRRKAFSE